MDLDIKKFFILYSKVYGENILLEEFKKIIGAITHIIKCCDEGCIERELEETISIKLIVSRAVTIIHDIRKIILE